MTLAESRRPETSGRSDHRDRLGPQDIETLRADIAFADFRIGEQQNCAADHNADVCIVPLDPAGVHRAKLGAETAAARYLELLDDPSTGAGNASAPASPHRR